MKLKDISRTAAFAWDQSHSSSPLIATGAVAGALDENFSNDSLLEIWAPDLADKTFNLGTDRGAKPKGSVTVSSRFNRIAWSAPTPNNARGVIAAGLESGEVSVFDPEKIMNGSEDARLFSNNKHTGPVRGLDLNPIQKNLLLTGAIKGELFIFDLNNPNQPIPPGPTSTKLGEITSLQWNPTVSRVFAASSSSGYTSVWDVRAQKEMVSLQFGGGAAKGMEAGRMDLQMGKRRGMSDVCWHPEQATRLVTACEDDDSPVVMLWDMRNTRAPERILSGHHKGVLSVAWCAQDSDLLLSCGKDNRTICWNPQSGDIVGELPIASDWAFQTSWCPRNPDLLATASFDGHISIHSLQATREPEPEQPKFSETATADDIFGALGDDDQAEQSVNVLSLTQPPKWLRRPVSATFGFGGLLASTSNLPGSSGKHQSGVVHLRNVVTESSIIDRAKALEQTAGEKDKLRDFCAQQAEKAPEDSAWSSLKTLFTSATKQDLVHMLGFSKEEVQRQVEEAVKQLPGTVPPKAEPVETPTAPSESGTQTASLFGDDVPGTPAASADFFSSMPIGPLKNPQLDHIVPRTAEVAESSVAATIGSQGSSARSEIITKENTFFIYPSGSSDTDRLITQALVLGDFSSAVDLCLASERFADALLLAVRGGPDLLQSTQKAYFERRTTSLPFLRVYQSIVSEDLADIVQNADLSEWKAIFAVVCTFSKEADFNNLLDQLGQRLHFRWQTLAGSDSPEAKASAKAAREDATMCFLAARRLEKVINVWIQEMKEEETATDETKYTAHAQALQSFIEKVAVFTAATDYVDIDLQTPTQNPQAAESGARTYRLASLYDRFYEYADLLATQGLIDMAAKYVQMTPSDYRGTGDAGPELDKARDRLLQAAGGAKVASSSKAFATQTKPAAGGYNPLNPYGAASTPARGPTQSYVAPPTNQSYATPPTNQTYATPPSQSISNPSYNAGSTLQPYAAQTPTQENNGSNPYAPTQSYSTPQYGTSNGYGESQSQGYGQYGAPQYGGQYGGGNQYGGATSQYSGQPQMLAPPPPPPRANANGTSPSNNSTPPPLPAAQRRDIPGWNDAPNFAIPKRPQSAASKESKAPPIMSPFPNMTETTSQAQPPQGMPQGMTPPPSRAQPGMLPPPPKGGPRPPSAQAVAHGQFDSPSTTPSIRPPPQGPPRGSPLRGGPPPGVIGGPPPSAMAGPPPSAMNAQNLSGGPPPGVIGGPPPRALSPLGPAGRQASPMMSQFRSPPPKTEVLPGRESTGQSAPTPPPAAPPAPSISLHPAGDRSHIPAKSRAIYETLSAELTRVKQSNLPAHVKRIVDDTDRRLNILFDGLNNETVPDQAISQMTEISKAISRKDANAALAMHVDLLTNSTGDMGSWTPGVKQLIRLGLP
ncbi:hypothetical protein BD324DRAFT_629551 [Kockovaella imperatae]|uniref:Protein transport protein SEC31 n=1 Tax=Kockovaella imperatae TaxID=4999 RepID=A0A1Y1UD19_9TREE|nr:hypothetical protein BD324DRAFT_629551 [Kockovaella imperatae]ORX35923.1 hypothetical protein BD324DRAFT_629551 [Kockovaella imperatae]